MPARLSALTTHKDKIFSYLEETSLALGITFGGVMGLDIAAREMASALEPVKALEGIVHGAYAGTLFGIAAAYTLPVLAKCFYHAKQNEDFSMETLLQTHHDKRWRLAGLFSGIAMGVSMTWGAIAAADNKPIDFSMVMKGGEQMMAHLGETVNQHPYGDFRTASLYTLDPATLRQEPALQGPQ